jgi:voltage-gated potassium channel
VPDGRPRDGLHLQWLRAEHGYLLVLGLVLVAVVFASSTPDTAWARSTLVLLAGAILVLALWAADVPRRLFVIGLAAVPLAAAAAAIALATEGNRGAAVPGLVGGLILIVVPIVMGYGIVKRPEVTFHSVFGAAAIYLLIGIFFAFVYDAAARLGSGSFFVQTTRIDRADLLYFSFSTLTTVGFGDLTAAGDVGRTLAIIEAIVGQLYLVVVVALIVAGLAATRSRMRG